MLWNGFWKVWWWFKVNNHGHWVAPHYGSLCYGSLLSALLISGFTPGLLLIITNLDSLWKQWWRGCQSVAQMASLRACAAMWSLLVAPPGLQHWRTHDKWVDRFGTRYQRSNMRCWEKTYHQLTVLVIWHLGLLLIAKDVNEDECRMWIPVTALTGCVWTNQAQ